MKSVRILLVGCGARNELEIPFRGMLASVPGCSIETVELIVHQPVSQQEAERISEAVSGSSLDLLLLCLSRDPDAKEGANFFELARRNKWSLPIVAVCPIAKPNDVVELLSLGASDVLTMSLASKEVIPRLLTLCGRGSEPDFALDRLRATLGLEHIIGESPAFVALIKQVSPVAKYDVSILMLGETGTGKEVFARAIHYRSRRSAKPFIPVNCGAIPIDLVENEFFGHETGAFTSANSARRGVITEADGGTLFLDEVDSLPLLAQVKLLRFLQAGEFRPLGSERICRADVRVIAASNANFKDSLQAGRFRKDLYYRLNVLSLKLPPLRDREEDIILLARHFLAKYTDKFDAPAHELSPAALQKLVSHTWPGNVRELENVIQRAVVLADQSILKADHICTEDSTEDVPEQQTFQKAKAKAIDQFEENYVRRLLLIHEGNITKAAQAAGKDRRAFWELMRKHRILARQPRCTARQDFLH